MKRAHIYFTGRVQGVGFRYTARQLAAQLGLVGWVKNLPSGEVEAITEGDEKRIQEFLDQIKEHFRGGIEDCRVDFQDAYGEFKSFDVTH